MAEEYPDVRNFWDDFNDAYNKWASQLNLEHNFGAVETISAETIPAVETISASIVLSDNIEYLDDRILIQAYCSKHFHAQNCIQCEDLCEIQNMKPCRTIWTDLSEECCRTCDLFVADCEVKECPVQSTFSSDDLDDLLPIPPVPVNATSSSYGNNEDFRDSNLYYVLVILLPISCFLGRGTNCFF